MIRKMKIDAIINCKLSFLLTKFLPRIAKEPKHSDLGLDFASFLLRYHRNLYYEHFSDSHDVVSRIKRAETFRAWADIEDLAIGYEKISRDFNNH